MASVGTVVIELDANTAKLIEGVKQSQRQINQLQKTVNNAKKSFKDIAKYAIGFYAVAKGIGAAAGAAKSFVNTSAQFEQYETTLKSITGSSQEAKRSMDWITDFTAKTPFQLAQVTEAFVKMKAYGLNPMDGTLTTLGDTASAMGKDVIQAVEAVADAVTGENERLKEFGIKAKKDGDTVAYAWADSSGKSRNIVIKNNKEIIQSTLNAIFNEKYVGAMAEQSKTWNGIISNISDKWTMFQRDAMEQGGLFNYLKAVGLTFSSVMSEVFDKGKGGAKGFADFVIESIKSLIRGAGVLSDAFSGFGVVFGVLKTAFWQFVGVIGTGINTIQEAWNTLGNTMSSLWATVSNGVKDVFATAINWIIDKINAISSTVNKAASTVGIGEVFGELDRVSFAKTKAEIVEMGEPIANVATAWKYAQDAQADYEKDMESIASGAGQQKAEEIITRIDQQLKKVTATEKESNAEKDKARQQLEDHIKKYGQVASGAKDAAKAAKEYAKGLAEAKDTLAEARLAPREVEYKKLGDKLSDLGKYLSQAELAEIYESEVKKMYNVSMDFTDQFKGMLEGIFSGDFIGGIKGFFDGMATDLLAPTINKLSETMSGGLSSMLSGLGSFAGPVGGAIMTGVGFLFDGIFGDKEETPPVLEEMRDTSESMANSLEYIKDVQYPMLTLTREMRGYLQTISLAFGGVENSLLRSGIDIGGNLFQDTYKKGTLFGGKSTSLYGTSINVNAATIAELMNGEITAMLDTVTKTVKTKWYGAKKTSYSHQFTNISGDIGEYVANATTALFDSLTSAGESLGIDLTIEEEVRKWVPDAEQGIQSGLFGGISSFFNRLRTSKLGSIFKMFGTNAAEETGKWVTETVTSSLENEIIDIGKFDTTGMSAEEVAAEIQGRFSAQMDAITEKYFGVVKEFQKAGEGLGETLFRVITNFDQVSHSMDLIGKSVDWRTANIITDVAGGLDAFNSSFMSYANNFYTEQEQFEMMRKTNTEAFQALGLSMPKTNAEFRSLIEGIDTTTDSGAELFGELIGLADAFNEMTTAGGKLGETFSKISEEWTGNLSYLTALQKEEYAKGYLEIAKASNGAIDTVDAARRAAETALGTAATKEEYIPAFNAYIKELENNAPKSTTDDVVARLDELINRVEDLEETTRKVG